MSTTHHWELPLTRNTVATAQAGDMVYLNGEIVITAGIPTLDRMLQFVQSGKELPMDLRGGTLFHLGSYSREVNGELEILYMNPTTSTRFNGHMPTLIRELDLRAVGGKGGLDKACAETMKDVGCVYLSFLGGGATLLTASIKNLVEVAWSDLIAHYRLVRVRVEDLGPLTVGIDAHDNSLYDNLLETAKARVPSILNELKAKREAESLKGR